MFGWLKVILGFASGLFSFFHDRNERQAGENEIKLDDTNAALQDKEQGDVREHEIAQEFEDKSTADIADINDRMRDRTSK